MTDAGKRTVQVNVKMNEDDYALLKMAAVRLWPGAVVSNSAILLSLAKIAARQSAPEEEGVDHEVGEYQIA